MSEAWKYVGDQSGGCRQGGGRECLLLGAEFLRGRHSVLQGDCDSSSLAPNVKYAELYGTITTATNHDFK